MYIIYNEHRHAYKTYDGWTSIEQTDKGAILVGLNNVMRFTKSEAHHNYDAIGDGSHFVYFPRRSWRDYT